MKIQRGSGATWQYFLGELSTAEKDNDVRVRLLSPPALSLNLHFQVVAEQGAPPRLC